MQHIDTLITARWILPIEPVSCVLEHHALAIHHGRILALAPADELRGRYEARELIDRPRHVLLPGFVNAHTRAAAALLRGAAEALPLAARVRQLEALERRWIDAQYVREGTELALADMLTSGATCYGDVQLFPEIVAATVSEHRMRVSIGLPVGDAPTVWADSAGECLDKGLRLHDEYRDDPLISTALAPYEPAALSDATLERVRRAADELELPVVMRVAPDLSAQAPGGTLTARLERLGLVTPLLAAVDALGLDSSEIDRLAHAGASIVHRPQGALEPGPRPASELAARGANVALGADGAVCNSTLSMLDALRTAAVLERALFPEAAPLDSHDWLRIATLNGARALGLAESIGSLVPGKWADLCCIDLGRPQTEPVYDPAAQVLSAASRDQVSDVWVAGRALVAGGRLLHFDLERCLARAREWRERIAAHPVSL